jgi:hypothetical protein
MKLNQLNLRIFAQTQTELYAAKLFSAEWEERTGHTPVITEETTQADIAFRIDSSIENKDCFIIEYTHNKISFTAKTIRGLIYGYSLLLRKTTFKNGMATLVEDICGVHTPQKQIRGHQVGYRTTPNTYDAWDYQDYFRYQLDLMAFGANTIEHNGSHSKGEFKNRLMRYDQEEFLIEASTLADVVDMDVSIWHANDDDETEQQAVEERDRLYSLMTRLDYCFIPGGDPGDLQADEFIKRCKLISEVYKKHHPKGKMHISAQAPHTYADWGGIFVKELSDEPDEFDAE